MLTRDEIKDEIRRVLADSFHRRSRPDERVFMTAYQILSFMDDNVRDFLVQTEGLSGRGAGSYNSAASAVAKMLIAMSVSDPDELDIAMLDARRLRLELEGQGPIEPGSNYGCGLYRLRRPAGGAP
jgi:hypothetical protein